MSGATRCGSDDGDDGGNTVVDWADDAPVLAGLAAASVQGRVALGARAGARRRGNFLTAVTEPPGLGPCHARHNGFDLHAGLCVPADQRLASFVSNAAALSVSDSSYLAVAPERLSGVSPSLSVTSTLAPLSARSRIRSVDLSLAAPCIAV